MTAPAEAVLIGAGMRGRHVYGGYARAHPDRLRIVAVAEPDPEEYLRRVALDRLDREPEIAAAVFDFLGSDENTWAREDLLRRLRDPYEPALREVASKN